MSYHKISGVILLIVGVPVLLIVVESSIDQGWAWIRRTGWQGIAIAIAMIVSGSYCLIGGKYNLLVRIVCTVLLVLPGGTLALFIGIGVAQGESVLVFLAYILVIGTVYLILIVTTGIDFLRWIRSEVG